MKTLALIVRRADHSREAFRKHYEEIHSPLAMQTVMQGTSRYVKYHLREEIHGAAAFDVISAFVYRDPTAAAALFARVQGPEGERIRADEQTFMDTARNQFFVVSEEFEQGRPDPEQPLLAVALVRRPTGESRSDFVARYAEHSIPALLAAVDDPVWCLHNVAAELGEPRYDGMTQVHARADRDLRGWARELEASGCEVLVASVYEDETPTPW